MARKTIRVRLYRVQDYDLYTLFYDPVFSLGDAFRIAVTTYAEQQIFPQIYVGYVQDLPLGSPSSISVTFVLKSQKAIDMLQAATNHGRNANNLIKNILRRSILGIERLYFDPEDAEEYRDIGMVGQKVFVPQYHPSHPPLIRLDIPGSTHQLSDPKLQERKVEINGMDSKEIPDKNSDKNSYHHSKVNTHEDDLRGNLSQENIKTTLQNAEGQSSFSSPLFSEDISETKLEADADNLASDSTSVQSNAFAGSKAGQETDIFSFVDTLMANF